MSLNPFSLTSILKQHILLMSPLVNINSKSHRGVTGYNCGTRECSQLFSWCNAPTLFKINMPHTRSKRILDMCTVTLSVWNMLCVFTVTVVTLPPLVATVHSSLSLTITVTHSEQQQPGGWPPQSWLSTSHAAMYSRDDTGDVVTIVT